MSPLQGRRWLAGGVAAAGAGVAALLWRVDPNAAGSPLPPCPLYWATGLYCPGCGSTRCLHALVHGDLAGALAHNPVLVLALPVVALLLLEFARALPAALAPLAAKLGDARPWAVGLLAYALLRNLPWEPFRWLAPGA